MAFDLQALLKDFGHSSDDLHRTGLKPDDLEKIHAAHSGNIGDLKRIGESIADRLKGVREVHLVSHRPKHADRLIDKIIRKKIENPSREISPQNYTEEVTDLIGIRALHLFKGHWGPIHDFIAKEWKLHETPKAYYREGDAIEAFKKRSCDTTLHRDGYRSVHYVVKDACLAEIQVRTVFEEGWGEIDHRFRYSRGKNHLIYDPYLLVFNRLALTADEMGTLLLKIRMQLRRGIFSRTVIADLKTELGGIPLTSQQRESILKKLERLEEASTLTGPLRSVPLMPLYAKQTADGVALNWSPPNLSELDPLLDQEFE